MNHSISPTLGVELFTLPGSAQINVAFPDGKNAMFDPVARVWHHTTPAPTTPESLLAAYSAEDNIELVAYLIRYSEKRRKGVAH
jgi:hypothetical protein